MSLEHPALQEVTGSPSSGEPGDLNFWHRLIDETAAGDFLGLTDRTMQALRQRGDGPKFIRISSRCIRYRCIDLKAWADARMRSSTSDPGQEAA